MFVNEGRGSEYSGAVAHYNNNNNIIIAKPLVMYIHTKFHDSRRPLTGSVDPFVTRVSSTYVCIVSDYL